MTYTLKNGRRVRVDACGEIIPGLPGSYHFPPEPAEVRDLVIGVFDELGDELSPGDLGAEWEAIREWAEEQLVDSYLSFREGA